MQKIRKIKHLSYSVQQRLSLAAVPCVCRCGPGQTVPRSAACQPGGLQLNTCVYTVLNNVLVPTFRSVVRVTEQIRHSARCAITADCHYLLHVVIRTARCAAPLNSVIGDWYGLGMWHARRRE